MARRSSLKYTDEIRSYIWDRYQLGDSVTSIGRSFDRSSSSIHSQLARTGGIRPSFALPSGIYGNVSTICRVGGKCFIYTGQHIQHTGVFDNLGLPWSQELSPDFPTLATVSGHTSNWNNDDSRLYYQDFNKLWAVDIDLSAGVAFGKRDVVADFGYAYGDLYDVDKNGRIVFVRHRNLESHPPVLIMNWEHMLDDER
jgi:hypothetical protein